MFTNNIHTYNSNTGHCYKSYGTLDVVYFSVLDVEAERLHSYSRWFLHNREDLVNFDQAIGISSFYGEKHLNPPINY